MLKNERHSFIMREINLHNKVLSSDLSVQLNISEDTVRRDLKELAEAGQILKVHGGAVSRSFHHPFNANNAVYALEAKRQIAAKTIQLLKDDMVVLTGGGTTMIELAKMIPEGLRITFFTISPLVELQLVEHQHITVISIGGQLSKGSNVHIGASVINQLTDIKVDLCLLGTNGVSVVEGMTDSDWEIVQVKRAMIRAARKLVVLSIAEKLNSVQRMKVCDTNLINYLVTELPPDHPQLAAYRSLDIELL